VALQRYLGISGPNPVQIHTYPVKSTASFNQGDFVVLTSTGLDHAAAASASFANPTSNAARIVGRAIDPSTVPDGSGAQATYAAVEMAAPGVWFQLPLFSPTSAATTPAMSYIGTKYGGYQTSGNFPSVNLDDTTNVVFMLVDYDADSVTGWPGITTFATQSNPTVWAEVLASGTLCTGAR
jgi:hypothetical protein